MLASMLLVTHSLSLLLQVATLSRGATPNKVRLRAEPCQAILPAHFGLSGASVNNFALLLQDTLHSRGTAGLLKGTSSSSMDRATQV